jgi:hypothetical protein
MDKQTLEALINKNYTSRQIALENNIGQTSVRYWIKKHGLKLKRGGSGKHPKGFILPRKCLCGETDPAKFYGHKKSVCGKCHNKYTSEKGREKKEYAVIKLGGCCKVCGFNKYNSGLDIHHLDPSKKDPNFRSHRSWKKERIDKELEHCMLLCKTCHAGVHSKDIIL